LLKRSKVVLLTDKKLLHIYRKVLHRNNSGVLLLFANKVTTNKIPKKCMEVWNL
jgi:hypothetical protein